MLRPAGCQIRFALPCKVSLPRPTVSRRSSSTCILSVPKTAKRHSVVPPTNQSASSFSAWVQACRAASFVFVLTRSFLIACPPAQRYPPFDRAAREHPKGVLSHDPYVRRL